MHNQKFIINKMIAVMLLCMLLVLLSPTFAFARLYLLAPEEMIVRADLIATGTVIELSPEVNNGPGDQKKGYGKIKVNKILKGDLENDILTLNDHAGLDGNYKIPPIGTEVFILLQKDKDAIPNYFNSANHIGVIKNDKVVEIYAGINDKIHPYLETYNKYYLLKNGSKLVIQKTTENSKTKSAKLNNDNNIVEIIVGITILLVVIALANLLLRKNISKKGTPF